MPPTYIERYLPILIFISLAAIVGLAMLTLSSLVGWRRPSRTKAVPYESGMTPVGDTRHPMNVKFYLVAMLFILFDVEAVFLYPWAVVFKDLGMFGFLEMIVYIAIIMAGFFYIWKRGAIDWNRE